MDDRTRKTLTLVTLGASLDAVQDFYSHSDWIHNDFDKTDVKMVSLPSGGLRAPTWFEFRDRHKDPAKWPFRVQSGIYPPIPGARKTHTHMNRDNSRLTYREFGNPGAPLRSQADYHNAGPAPARGDGLAANIEWVKKVEENSGARKAIERPKGGI